VPKNALEIQYTEERANGMEADFQVRCRENDYTNKVQNIFIDNMVYLTALRTGHYNLHF
jgi:hypothetical protein